MGKTFVLFTVGGGIYTGLELLYRGRSHLSMFALGGGCFLAIGSLGRKYPRLPLRTRAVLGSLICTGGELATGLLLNRDHHIWDYRGLPLNFRGQICLPFSLLWIPLSAAAAVLFRWLDGKSFRIPKKRI